ncbi:MAG TPA: amidohydrolase family protein [Xanthobacteraceae bacterium]|jgi:aminocarboxymuconate-semialdehyde decarboxylase
MITDVHVHHVPAGFLRFVQDAACYSIRLDPPCGETVRLQVGTLSYHLTRTFFDLDRLIARMDEMRVERALLSIATPFVNFDVPAGMGEEAAQIYNNEIAAVRSAAPDRLQGWAYLPMQDPDAAAHELSRSVRSLRLIGGYVPSNVNGRYLHSEEFAPVFRVAAELDVPLLVHPSNPPARERMVDYELAVVAGYLLDTTLNIFHMICGGLLDRYPALHLCFTHLGGYAPLLLARMQRELDTNAELAGRLKRPLRDYLRSLYYDTICFEPCYLRAAVDSGAVDPTHLLLGSDTPFPLGEPDPVDFIERSYGALAPDLAGAILHDNAARFLNARRGADR